MIANHDNGGLVPKSKRAQFVENAAELLIGKPNFAVVEIGLCVSEIRRLRMPFIVKVRVVEVHPQEELLLSMRLQERDALVCHLAGRGANRLGRAIDVHVQRRTGIIVVINCAFEAALVGAIEVEIGIKGSRGVTQALHGFGDHALTGRDARPPDRFVPLDG